MLTNFPVMILSATIDVGHGVLRALFNTRSIGPRGHVGN